MTDPRVHVLRNEWNLGVGGATMTGYRAALSSGADIIVKLDGDGQMDPALIQSLIRPILDGDADYVKGNRFYDPAGVESMPALRIAGNAVLTFFAKLSTGYWRSFDPTNGFTAIHRTALARLPLDRISERYFFESDILFRLNTIRAVVQDMPMMAVYGSERSNLKISRIVGPFLIGHVRNTASRFAYNYLLRDFSAATVEVLLGLPGFLFGFVFGLWQWRTSIQTGVPASAGTVMVATLPLISGLQFLLAAVSYDIASVGPDSVSRTPS